LCGCDDLSQKNNHGSEVSAESSPNEDKTEREGATKTTISPIVATLSEWDLFTFPTTFKADHYFKDLPNLDD
jgi:hypothetical protein